MSISKVAELMNKRFGGKTKAARLSQLAEKMKYLHSVTSGACLNFGDGYRTFSDELGNFSSLQTMMEKGESNGVFSLFQSTERRSTQVRGVAPTATSWPWKDSLAGLVVLYGNRGAGKTTYMMNSLEVEIIIRVGEPSESVDNDERVIQAISLEEAFSFAFLCAAAGISVAIDGLRSLIFSGVGTTTAAGISSNVYTFLTAMNNIMANAGHTVVVTLNPMTARQFEEVEGSIIASVSGVVTMVDQAVVRTTYRGSDGRIFAEGVEMTQDKPADNMEASIVGSLSLAGDSTQNRAVLPFSATDFDDDDLPPPRHGSRITIAS